MSWYVITANKHLDNESPLNHKINSKLQSKHCQVLKPNTSILT